MKRNMERSSGSSDEDKTSLKKAKKENSKSKNKETEIGESIDGSKKRVAHCKVEVEEHMLKVKRVRTENAGDQKTVNNKIGCNVNHKNDSDEKDTEQRNDKDIVTVKLVTRETFTNGKYKKSQNSCNGETKLEKIIEESVSNCDQETTDEDGSRREETMINNEEYVLLAEELTGLFRDIYRDAMARNGEENSISKCKIRSKTLDSVIKISNAKGESYLCNMTNSKKYNSNYACNSAEKSDESLETEAKNCNSDKEVGNERLNESNNRSFRLDSTNTKSFRDINRIVCEDSNSSWNSEMNDEGFRKLSSNTYEEYGVQSGQTNRKREGNKAIEMTDKFADCQRNAKSHEEYSTRGTSDEVSDNSTDVKISDEEGKYSSGDAEYDRRCNELINAEKIKRMKCKVEKDTSSYERDRSELEGESDMSTDEDTWSAEENDLGTEESDNSSEEELGDDSPDEINNEEIDSSGTEESDNSSEEESDNSSEEESDNSSEEGSDNSSEEGSDDDNTNQSSDEVSSSYGEENSETSSGENDSTGSESPDGESGMSTDEDSSNESEYDNDSEAIDENPEEDKNTSYEEIDSEIEGTRTLSNGESSKTIDITDDESSNSACEERNNSTDLVAYYRGARKVNVTSGDGASSVISGKAHAMLNYRSKEIIDSSTEDENCLDCTKECCSSETVEYLSDSENIKNKKTLESVSELNDESSSEGSKSSDDMSDLESLFGGVLGFASHRRLSIETLGQDSIIVSVTRLKLMPFKDYYRESVDGRHKKRIVANRKGNIITPTVTGNFKDEKTEKRGRYRIQKKVSDKNKAAEVSDAEEQTSDEELQAKDSPKSRNKKGNKQIEYDSDHKEDSESDEDYNEEDDENSSEGAGEDNDKRHGDEEEDIGEEDSDEDYEEEADNEYDEDDDELEEEEVEYEVEEEEECDSEENVEEHEEDEDNEEDVDENVTALMQNDSSEQSSGNDEGNTLAKSRTMTKKKAAKEQARGKTNLVKKKKDRGE